jgi:uncharacterized LabA/DUF88 family protein
MVLPNQIDRVAVFFDMSNLYFVARDLGVRIDYARLLEFLVAGRRLVCAYAYVTLAGEESSAVPFLTWLRRNGFRVVTRTLRRGVTERCAETSIWRWRWTSCCKHRTSM